MKTKQFIAGIVAVGALSVAHEVKAACSIPAFVEANYDGFGNFNNFPNSPYTNGWGRSGDFEYANQICQTWFSNDVWWAYNFHVGNWNDGRGFENFCDLTKFLGRTYTGLYVLNWSSPTPAPNWSDLSGSPLRWAGNYAHLAMDELDGECYWDSGANAHTVYGPFIDNYTDVYKGFVYGQGVSTRASVILHESRHADWISHDGNDADIFWSPGGFYCPAGGTSCDEVFTWNDGSQARANSYEVWFLNDFWWNAVGTTLWHQVMAQDRGNWVLANRFDSRPTFRI